MCSPICQGRTHEEVQGFGATFCRNGLAGVEGVCCMDCQSLCRKAWTMQTLLC
jgi:hypothetical protein